MWIYTRRGFCSVRAVDEKDLMVRFRTARHARYVSGQTLSGKISVSDDTDYRYRIVVSRKAFADFVSREIASIGYSNFKDSVPRDDPGYVRTLGKTWCVHHAMQTEEMAGRA